MKLVYIDQIVDAFRLVVTYGVAVYRATCWLLWLGWVYVLLAPKPIHFSFYLLSHTLPTIALLAALFRILFGAAYDQWVAIRFLNMHAQANRVDNSDLRDLLQRATEETKASHVEFFPPDSGSTHV